jgi:hypothetical protein
LLGGAAGAKQLQTTSDFQLTMRVTGCYWLILAFALGPAGCGENGGERVRVAGTVLIDGKPLTSGTIRFVPEVGRPASSAILADGSFELASDSVNRVSEAGVRPGNYRVQVSASKVVDDETIRWNAPEKYADFRTSGLNVTIDKPIDDLVLELTWGGAEPAQETDSLPDEQNGSDAKGVESPSPAEAATSPDAEDAT